MSPTDILGLAAGISGVAMGLSPLFQAHRATVTGSARDVSLGAVMTIFSGGVVWLAYGWVTASAPLVATNAAAVLSAGICLGVSLRLRRPTGADERLQSTPK